LLERQIRPLAFSDVGILLTSVKDVGSTPDEVQWMALLDLPVPMKCIENAVNIELLLKK